MYRDVQVSREGRMRGVTDAGDDVYARHMFSCRTDPDSYRCRRETGYTGSVKRVTDTCMLIADTKYTFNDFLLQEV